MQLSYRDVFLSFFNDKKRLILSLKSGCKLINKGRMLYCEREGKPMPVLMFSKKCYENIQSLIDKGYYIHSSKIRFIVAWREEGDDKESAVILPDVVMRVK